MLNGTPMRGRVDIMDEPNPFKVEDKLLTSHYGRKDGPNCIL